LGRAAKVAELPHILHTPKTTTPGNTMHTPRQNTHQSNTPVRRLESFMLGQGRKVAELAQVLQVVHLPAKLGVGEHPVQLVQVQVSVLSSSTAK
jgi:hypothetical protein